MTHYDTIQIEFERDTLKQLRAFTEAHKIELKDFIKSATQMAVELMIQEAQKKAEAAKEGAGATQ